MNINRLVFAIEDVINAFKRHTVAANFVDYCDLETVIGLDKKDLELRPWLDAPYIGVTREGAYMSVFEVSGTLREMDENPDATGNDSLEALIAHLCDSLNSAWRNKGHRMGFVFERDPARGRDEVAAMTERQMRSLEHTGIQLQDVVAEKVTTLAPWLVRERAWLVIWSGTNLIARGELGEHYKNVRHLQTLSPPARFGQQPWLWMLSALKIRHDAFINMVEGVLNKSAGGLLTRLLTMREVGNEIRREVARDATPAGWYPAMPDDCVPAGLKREGDDTALLSPKLNLQLFTHEAVTHGNLVKAGGLWHGMVTITLGPQSPQTFNQLVRAVPREIPWRISMQFAPGGMQALGGKKMLLSYAAFIGAIRPMYDAVTQLAKVDEQDPVCVMTVVATTWGSTREACIRNQAILQSAIEGWGVCGTTTTFGDPRRAWVNTMPGASSAPGPVALYPPLSHALSMLPLNRAGSVWRGKGNLMLHTEDGAAWEVGLASSQQLKHTELAPGDSGIGKSVLINVLSEVMIASAQKSLPYIAYIDKGFTALALVELIRDALPPSRRDEAVGITLTNDPAYTRNLFDVMYGARYPVTPEKNFIASVLLSLCVDPSTGMPCNPVDTKTIILRLIEEAYRACDQVDPKRYRAGEEAAVDAALGESGIGEKHDGGWWEAATWYEVRDMLHDAGYQAAAQRAHYRAMPTLAEVAALVGHPGIRDTFGRVQRDGSAEPLLDYVQRCLNTGHSDYPMMSGCTRFQLNPATRIAVVDLNNVVGDSTPLGRLKTGIMYLLAGQITGGDFVLPQYRDEVLKNLPPAYHAGMLDRQEQLDREVKTKVYDELHNARGVPVVWEGLDTQEREQRKFGIRTVLSTQHLSDYPESILKTANTLWLLRFKEEDVPLLKNHFNVPEVTLRRFLKMPTGASPDGSGVPLLGVFRIKNGTLARILKFTVGPLELWAINSNPKDRALRNLLTQKVGSVRARQMLAANFPRGSALPLIELREQQHATDDVTGGLVAELIKKQGYDI